MARRTHPNQEELNRIFIYDKETGRLYNKIHRSSKALIGRESGCLHRTGYIRVCVNKTLYFAHNLIWIMNYGYLPNGMIDHKNGNKLDNKIENLREANDFENQYNRPAPKDNRSGYKGVSFCRQTGNWQSAIGYNGKRKHLGRYKTKEEAYEAYCMAAKELHANFVRLK